MNYFSSEANEFKAAYDQLLTCLDLLSIRSFICNPEEIEKQLKQIDEFYKEKRYIEIFLALQELANLLNFETKEAVKVEHPHEKLTKWLHHVEETLKEMDKFMKAFLVSSDESVALKLRNLFVHFSDNNTERLMALITPKARYTNMKNVVHTMELAILKDDEKMISKTLSKLEYFLNFLLFTKGYIHQDGGLMSYLRLWNLNLSQAALEVRLMRERETLRQEFEAEKKQLQQQFEENLASVISQEDDDDSNDADNNDKQDKHNVVMAVSCTFLDQACEPSEVSEPSESSEPNEPDYDIIPGEKPNNGSKC